MSRPADRLVVALVCVFLIIVIVLSIVVTLRPWKTVVKQFDAEPDLAVGNSIVVHVNMTTIPERFESDWFSTNMRRIMTTMRGNFVWWCNVPPSFGSTGQLYVVSPKVKQLLADFPNFRLFHTEQDWGPITKVLGGLYNPDIKLTDAMLICDDDVQYLPDFVIIAAAHFAKNPARVYTYCGSGIQGFRGYLFQKMMCLALPSNMPISCRRIDDDLLDMYFQGRTAAITYHGSTEAWCTIDGTDWGDWHTEQHIALSRDNRPPMVAACRKDYYRHHREGLRSTFFALESGCMHSKKCVVNLQTYYPPPAQLSFRGLAAPPTLGEIPKIIWRTAKDDSWQVTCRSAFEKTAQTNPDWQQRVVTNEGMLAYIRDAYSTIQPIVEIAHRIQLGVMLADLWRLLVLFDQGGLYLDLKSPVVKPIQNLKLQTNKAYVCQWKTYPPHAHLFKGGEIVNGAIMAPPRNLAIWSAVCQVIANLQACQVHEDQRFMLLAERTRYISVMKSRVLCTTGPIAFTHALLTRPHDIVLVAPQLNGHVSYMPPKPGELLELRADHYSKYTRRFLKPLHPVNNCVPCILHVCSISRDSAGQTLLQNIAAFVPSTFDVRFYSGDDCAQYMASIDKTGKCATIYATLPDADKVHAFKYAVLHEYGGVWIDINAVLLQRLDSFIDLSIELTSVLCDTTVDSCVMACAPKMAILSQALVNTIVADIEYWDPSVEQVNNLPFLTNNLTAQLSARHAGSARYKLVPGRNQGVRFDFDLLVSRTANNHRQILLNNKPVIDVLNPAIRT
jgi:hypothetical protein